MEQLVLLDFCDTVVTFQTFNPFVMGLIEKYYPNRYKILNNKFVKLGCFYLTVLFHKLSFNVLFDKYLMIRFLKGIPRIKMVEYAKNYYENTIKQKINEKTINLIKKYQSNGSRIIIVSGGSDIYLKYFATEFQINDVVATEFKFENDICMGELNGYDCMGKNKVNKLNEYLKKNNIVGDFCACITDSISDKPILDLCKNKIVISKEKHQNWVTNDMTEIIW